MVTAILAIREWFKTVKKPTQEQFWATYDSFWHKYEMIPQNNISNLTGVLGDKEDKAQKGAPNGYAPLNISGKVPDANLPLKVVSLTTPTGVPADGDEWVLYTL